MGTSRKLVGTILLYRAIIVRTANFQDSESNDA